MNKNRHALIILNTSYKDHDLNNLLVQSDKSFDELKSVLEDPGLGNFEVNFLLNESSYKVKSKISAFFSKSDQGDLLLLYVVGYCLEDKDKELHLIFSNTLKNMLTTTAISLNFINNEMSASKSNQLLALLDCYYVIVSDNRENVERKVEVQDFFRGSEKIIVNASNILRNIGDLANERVIHKCNFTSRFIKTVKSIDVDQNDDNNISLDELYTYLKGITDSVDERTSMEMHHINKRKFIIKDLIISSNAKKLASTTTTTSTTQTPISDTLKQEGPLVRSLSSSNKKLNESEETRSEQSFSKASSAPSDSSKDYYYEGSPKTQGANLKIVIPIIGAVTAIFVIVLASSGFLDPQSSTDLTTTGPTATEPVTPIQPQVIPADMNNDFSYIFEDEENEIEVYVYGDWRELNTMGPTNDCSFEVVRFQNSTLGGLKPTNLFVCTEGLSDKEISIEDIFVTRRNNLEEMDTNDVMRLSEPDPAYEIRWTNDTLRSVELGTIANDKLYTLAYYSDPKSFEDNCNVVKKIVDSFKITSLDESHPFGLLICNY